MEVKPGYKRTSAGVIPDAWETSTGVELTTLIGKGGSPRWQGFSYAKNGMLFVTSENVRDGFLDVSEPKYLPLAFHEKLSQTKLRKGDILINLVGASIGRSCQVTTELGEANVNQAVAVFRVREQQSASFIAHYFQAPTTIKRILKMQVDAARPNLSLGNLRRFSIAIPPPPERRAIAEALSDIDALLGALDRLIAKKRDLKQAAMQQLLTGQTRLPGFHGEWEDTTLGNIGECIIGLTYKPENVVEHGLLVLRSSNIQNGRLSFDDNVHVNLEVSEHLLTRSGDILICVRNGSRALIGKCAVIDESAAGLTFGAFMSVFRTKHWRFIIHALQAGDIQRQIRDNIGATINQITNKDMRAFRVKLPPDDEQTAIAEVLTDMDAELATLEQRREKTRALKQAMMQELLTGRIRLVSPTENIIPLFEVENVTAKKFSSHNWQINEAVVISVLANHFGSEQWPLGRKRYTKFSYLLHRHVEKQAEGYLKKAAGPYNPATKYKGPEAIAVKNKYVRRHIRDEFSGFIAAENIAEAETYFAKWYGSDALNWLEQFQKKTNDELELLATVDMAMEDIRSNGHVLDLDAVKTVIREHPEWEAKLSRPIFSDVNITRAINISSNLFATNLNI